MTSGFRTTFLMAAASVGLASAACSQVSAPSGADWDRYRMHSAELQRIDRAFIDAELRALGRDSMVPAPDNRSSFAMSSYMKGDYFKTDSAKRLAEAILSYQAPNGGWSKHMDLRKGPRAKGTSFFSENASWSWISTIDNNATTEEMRFLASAFAVTGDDRYRAPLLRGLDYLLAAQYPTGCFPQVYPLMGGYHDAMTFNDDATVNALRVIRDVSRGTAPMVGFTADQRARSDMALQNGVQCLLATQVRLNGGVRTVWGQQHDPVTLAPVGARSYEHASLASRESAAIMQFLMELNAPDARIVSAVHGAADWLNAHKMSGMFYDPARGIIDSAGAGPVWARMIEIKTDKPIFSNRDGIVLYDYHKLTDRAVGYAWFVTEPAKVLANYEQWAKQHPRAAGGTDR